MRTYLIIISLIFITDFAKCQFIKSGQYKVDSIKLTKAIASDTDLKRLFQSFNDPYILLEQYIREHQKSEEEFQNQESKIQRLPNFGQTQTLRIIPIVEWFTVNDSYLSIDGVSYIVQVDSATILFDLGSYNQKHSGNIKFNLVDTKNLPAPLPYNLNKAGFSFSEIDYIVISHDHCDHTGGNGEVINTNTIYLDTVQFDLGDIKVYTPVKMEYPNGKLIHSVDPIKICEGVATTGVISNYDFFVGKMQEQALAINVKDNGIVFIVGCGHQTIPKLLKRLHTCFDEPLYGLIGGLHLSCSNSRNMGFLKYVGSGRPPWSPIDKDIIKEYIKELKLAGVKMIGLSAHDSCDSTLAIFKNAFDKRYVEIRAGQPIDVNIKKE